LLTGSEWIVKIWLNYGFYTKDSHKEHKVGKEHKANNKKKVFV